MLAPVITLQYGSEAFPLSVISTCYILHVLFPTFYMYVHTAIICSIFINYVFKIDCVKHLVNYTCDIWCDRCNNCSCQSATSSLLHHNKFWGEEAEPSCPPPLSMPHVAIIVFVIILSPSPRMFLGSHCHSECPPL